MITIFGANITITELFVMGLITTIGVFVGKLLDNTSLFMQWKTGGQREAKAAADKDVVEMSLSLLNEYKNEVAELRDENKTLGLRLENTETTWNTKFESLRIEYLDIQKELFVFKSWAERLVKQVYSLGHEPVSMILDTKDKDGD